MTGSRSRWSARRADLVLVGPLDGGMTLDQAYEKARDTLSA
jgi:hypothetical protein